ncbi:B-block binding subunit of TFIIIC family protein [Candida albicans]|uniref:B-block binding subunit of TFIIIC family protein n=1 Tax=Candida albicans TaxID=5476 RepID=A0A8H6C502_CANAX|nr:B-block binding subunit of TFIIIC family protein [Candida albicans]
MSFPCAPYEVVQFTIKKLSFSGKWGLTLDELWAFIQTKFNQQDQLDEFQKQLIWQCPVTANSDYKIFVASYDDLTNIRVLPEQETQVLYLTGITNNKKFLSSLGDKPYELLQEIAKHGSKGIWAPTLIDITGQDNRSLTGRLNKLEEWRLIYREKRFFTEKKVHSSWIVHIKFASISEKSEDKQQKKKTDHTNVEPVESDSNGSKSKDEENDEDGNISKYWKFRENLKNVIVESCKNAPHSIRVFRDLKRELRMHQTRSLSNLFRSILNALHDEGVIEKVNIKDEETSRLIYAIKYLKDRQDSKLNMETEFSEMPQLGDNGEDQEDGDDDDEDDDEARFVPSFNVMFPLASQLYQYIYDSKSDGISSRQILSSVLGQPRNRVYPDENDKTGVVRIVEAEGKIKFYKYCARENIDSVTVTKHKKARPVLKTIANVDFKALNKMLFVKDRKKKQIQLFDTPEKLYPAIKMLRDANYKQREDEQDEHPVDKSMVAPPKIVKTKVSKVDEVVTADTVSPKTDKPPLSKRKVSKESPKTTFKKRKVETSTENDIITCLRRSARSARKPPIKIEDDVLVDEVDNDYTEVDNQDEIEVLEKEDESDVKVELDHDSDDIITVEGLSTTESRLNKTGNLENGPVSLSSTGESRRDMIVELVESKGGIVIFDANVTRELDKKLESTTITDKRTIQRDIEKLQKSGMIEFELIPSTKGGQPITRLLIYSKEERLKPSDDVIEDYRKSCSKDWSSAAQSKKSFSNASLRTIESNQPKRRGKPIAENRRKPRTKFVDEISGVAHEDRSDAPVGQNVNTTFGASKTDIKQDEKSAPISKITDSSKSTKPTKSESSSFAPKRFKRKSAPERRSNNGKSSNRGVKKNFAVKFDKTDTITLFRAVCISKAFNISSIDYDAISELFDNVTVDSLRKTWSVTRKSIGGGAVVDKGVEDFQLIVMRGIDEGKVSAGDLEDIRISFFLDLWGNYEGADNESVDKMPLYKNVADNYRYYNKTTTETYVDTFEQIELLSMRMKEMSLASTPFYVSKDPEDPVLPIKPHDEIRTMLKAIFGTSKETSTSSKIDKLLSDFPNKHIQEASEAMIKDRELLYFGTDDSQNNFTLTDKVYDSLYVRISASFFNKAAQFKDELVNVFSSNKGYPLSQGIDNGIMAQLLDLVSSSSVLLRRIEKEYTFDGYESRLMDKNDLDCEIVLHKSPTGAANIDDQDIHMIIPVPTGKPCSRIWLDINGQIDAKLWRDIVVAILYHVHFRPGIPIDSIFRKFDSLLSVNDFTAVIDWLKKSGCIEKGAYNGYSTSNNWLNILGY